LSRPDAAINRFNEQIEKFVQRNLLNSVIWNYRYLINQTLVGETNEDLEYKSKILLDALRPFDEPMVVDVGCGDLEVVKSLPVRRYQGYDVAAEALEIARNKRPDWRFDHIGMNDRIEPGDVVLCLDVLIHQPTREQFLAMIAKLSAAARLRLIVSGYDEPPATGSEITRYYLPLSEALQRTGEFANITVLGRYGAGISVVVADKPRSGLTPSPGPRAGCREMRGDVDRVERLDAIDELSDQLADLLPRFMIDHGLRPQHSLLDIGCGSLLGGVRFIRYLEAGNYVGVDIDQSLLDGGFATELKKSGLQDKMPRENLVCISEFEFDRLGRRFDFALAHSLFTHLTFNRIRRCLERLAPVTNIDGRFFATFFELPQAASPSLGYTHHPGDVVTYDTNDPYHYKLADFFYAASGLPWRVRYIGNWSHPRGQRMLEFIRV
jgi:2-polyprenyl-3-methyl-5-hydroxy-6-metoxy-1,4-benzoquinol methylase